jgi:hypothetical protein
MTNHILTRVSSLFIVAVIATSCAKAPSPEAESWWSHVAVLATDEMEGRNTGSEGYRRAAEYVAEQFAKYGVLPGNDDSYFHSVGFVARTIREPESSLDFTDPDGKAKKITLGKEARFGMSLEPAPTTEAELVFVGYGLKVPEIDHDDFEDLDLDGKVAVYLRGGPKALTGPHRAHVQSTEERWKPMRAAGLIGQIYLSNPKHMDVPWERSTLRRLTASMTLADPALDKTPGRQLQITFNPEHTEMLFEGTGHTYAELLEMADREETLPRFEMPLRVRAKIAHDREELVSDNVVGILPGSDPDLKDEFVVLTGHLDGLGIGGAVDGDSVYNGAMDNASGIATMIEIARIVSEEQISLKRSLVLLALTGEEKGLLGSKAYAMSPTVDSSAIIANLNMDMYQPIIPFTRLITYGIHESELGDLIPALAEKYDVVMQPDPEPDRNIFVRSDQYNFIQAGVPALSFKFGAERESPEDATMKRWLTERYHAPADDLNQPVEKEAAAKFTRFLLDLCVEIANAPERPKWKPDSFFARFAQAEPAEAAE